MVHKILKVFLGISIRIEPGIRAINDSIIFQSDLSDPFFARYNEKTFSHTHKIPCYLNGEKCSHEDRRQEKT